MADKAYRFENGLQLQTEPEVKAYIRGLELARTVSEGCTEGRTEFLGKMSSAIEEANAVKLKGPTNEQGKTDAEVEADAAAAKKAEEEKVAEKQQAEADAQKTEEQPLNAAEKEKN